MSRISNDHNDLKKNKMRMGGRNNAKITQRELDEVYINQGGYNRKMDVDRIMLERQFTRHNYDDDEDRFIGELTGEQIDTNDVYDKGMPVRSSFTVKRSKYDNNSHLDFDLYEKIDKKHDNVGYSDTSIGGDYAGLDEAMKPITKGTDPYESCITDINTTTSWMHSNMYIITHGEYMVNGFGLFSAFGVIYLISKGNTEIELKTYFGYQDKRHLNAGLLTLREEMHKFREQIIMDNYIINDKEIPSIGDVAKKLKSLIFNVVINTDYINDETERVNNIIKTISNMSNVVSPNTLSKSNISLITVARLSPIWAYKIHDVVKSRIQKNDSDETLSFIRFMGKTFDHYEDAERQIIEVPLHGDVLAIGLIINKRGLQEPTELKELTTALNYMKSTVLDEVMIPIIKKRYKTRLNKTLQKTGLVVVFNEQNMDGLYPEGGTIDDCLQYIDLNFSTNCANKKCDNRGYRTTRKFICNGGFEFYLRNVENNCIMMFGRI